MKNREQLFHGCMYGLASEVTKFIAEASEANPFFIYSNLLAFFGASLDSIPKLGLGNEKYQTPSLFFVIVGNTSSARKGTSYQDAFNVWKYVVNDFNKRVISGVNSGEVLIDILAEDESLSGKLWYEPELGRLLTSNKRQGSTGSHMIRNAWDGNKLESRAKSGSSMCESYHLSFIGHITPRELKDLISDTDYSSGFANRMIWLYGNKSQSLPLGKELDASLKEKYINELKQNLDFVKDIGYITLSDDAVETWKEWYLDKDAKNEPFPFDDLSARGEAHVLRIAITTALLNGERNVSKECLNSAVNFWAYSKSCQKQIFSGSNSEQKILSIIESKPEGVSKTVINNRFGNKNLKIIDNVLELLLEQEKISETKTETNGRPATIYKLIK